MPGNLTPEDVIAYARSVEEGLEKLRRRVPCVVMFIDLVGSTEYKDKNPSEEVWLPRLAAFLGGVSQIVGVHGRVVKYVGDEVMAVFEGSDSVLSAEQAAEQVLVFCLNSGVSNFRVKIGLDFGLVSMLDFRSISQSGAEILGDPQGLVVDRCARLVSRALPNTALASSDLVKQSRNAKKWRKAGTLRAKGIGKPTPAFQLNFALDQTPQVTLADDMSLEDCRRALAETREKLEQLKIVHGH
jgi:class 3 adenylate cyclase